MRKSFYIILVFFILSSVTTSAFAETEHSRSIFSLTNNPVNPVVPKEPEPTPVPEPEPDPEPEPIPEPEPEPDPVPTPEPDPEKEKPAPTPKPPKQPNVPKEPEKPANPSPSPSKPREEPASQVTTPSSNPVTPTSRDEDDQDSLVEEVEVLETVEEVQLIDIDQHGDILKTWRESFDYLYISVLYDLLRYYYEQGQVINLDHLTKQQLSEMLEFLEEEELVAGSQYDDMRVLVREYHSKAE